ncbi:MAG: PIN domain-containing protein [Bacteroidales bacterium]|nr:PIN domain-containing protein [Bacteroidales bacterium]
MMVAFDTNVVLDAILRRPDSNAALSLLKAVADEDIIGVISANTITDIYYISQKKIGEENAREAVSMLLSVFEIAQVDGESCMSALQLPMKDYEDAILAVSVKKSGATYIVTRDQGMIQSEECPVTAISPSDLCNIIFGG